MKKNKILPGLGIFAFTLALLLSGAAFKSADAAPLNEYNTTVNISKQGENGFFYAWGTPEHYVLMDYGLAWSGGESWHGLEPYSHIAGDFLHPGDHWGVMIIWVANRSGKVELDGKMAKGSNQGDGAHLGLYLQPASGIISPIINEFVANGAATVEFPLKREFNVTKGDAFIFYADSGIAKNNSNDSCGAPFKITYKESGSDYAEGADLSVYLHTGRAGDIGGFKHIEGGFAAEVTDGTLTEKTVVTGGTTGGCTSAAAALSAMIGAAALALLKRGIRK